MNFSVVKISSLIDSVGESEVVSALSEFKCEKNPEIENFIKNNAVEFARRKISVTHFLDLVLSNRKKANAEQSAKNNAVPVHEGGVDAATSKGR